MSYKCWQQTYRFLVIDKDSALTNTEKNLMTLQYRNVIIEPRYIDVDMEQ